MQISLCFSTPTDPYTKSEQDVNGSVVGVGVGVGGEKYSF